MDSRLEQLADIFDVEPEKLTPNTQLSDLEWDSMAKITFMVLLQGEYKRETDVNTLLKIKTIQDALDLMV